MISKILFTIGIVVAIWKAFTMISKLTGTGGGLPGVNTRKADDPGRAQRPAEPKAVELQPCPRCGAFVDPRERCNCSA